MKVYLRKCLSKNLVVVGLIALLNIIYVTSAFIGMQIGASVIDGDIKRMIIIMIMSSGLWVIFSILEYMRDTLKAKTIATMIGHMREDINRNIISKQYQDYIEKDAGEYISWYTSDIKEAEIQGFNTFYTVVDLVTKVIVGSIALLMLRAELLILTAIVTAIIMFLSKLLDKNIEGESAQISIGMEKFTNVIKEQLMGFTILKYFGYTNKFNEDVLKASNDMETSRYEFVKYRSKIELAISGINIAGQFTINVVTFGMCALRILPTEVFFGSGNITGMTSNAIQELAQLRITLKSANTYFKKIEEQRPKVKSMDVKRENLEAIKDGIELKDLSFSYVEKEILSDLNMKFRIGGKYALVGESGSGKTTILKLLLGQLQNYQGSILFDGKDTKAFDENSFYKQMAYIEQNVFLYNRTIRENITLGGAFTEEQIQEALQKSALSKELYKFDNGLDTFVGDNGNRLSGGQKQRVAIARAIIHNKSILLVDEGTSALDKENAEAIEDTLLQSEGLTLILISHHLKEEKKKFFTEIHNLKSAMSST
ncbi:MAG: ATP-binding cassette domain-containing protein [Paraclostridium sp.]